MKKIFTFISVIAFVANMFSANTLNVINATTNYMLYFNTVTKAPSCYPEIREYNPFGLSGYCTLAADPTSGGSSISFSNYTQLNSYYPGLTMTKQNSFGSAVSPLSVSLASTYLNSLSMDWAYLIYKVTNTTTGQTEGAWIGFADFISCHNLPDAVGTYGVTATESFTTYTIGGTRYFVVGEY